MNILIIKSLFIPNKKYLDINLNNLSDLNDKFGNFYDLFLIGWVDSYQNELSKFISNKLIFRSVKIKIYDNNCGKYKIYNDIIDIAKQDNEHDYYIYFDHDIMLENNITHKIMPICKLLDNKIDGTNIGLILFNQTGDIRHKIDIYDNNDIIDNISICWSSNIYSMTCCAFITKKIYFAILSHLELISVYGFDDTSLIKGFSDMNLKTVITKDISIYHPFNYDKKYNEWKNKIIEMIATKQLKSYKDSLKDFNKNLFCCEESFHDLITHESHEMFS